MKTRIATFLIALFTVMSIQAEETVRSYFCQEMGRPGAYSGPTIMEHQATFVVFNDNNTLTMMDGTVWKYQGQRNGIHCYAFVKATNIIMPGTQYINLLFSPDYSTMQINYVFNPGFGFPCQMYALYRYIGEGRQVAFDWMSGKFDRPSY